MTVDTERLEREIKELQQRVAALEAINIARTLLEPKQVETKTDSIGE